MATGEAIRIDKRHTIVLGLLGIVAAALFVVTTLLVRAYRTQERSWAARWFDRGQAALGAGRAHDAVVDFRNALAYSRDPAYQLRLAEALIAAGRNEEGRGYLLSIWEHAPGNARINLLLARLAAQRGELQVAKEYYHDAIHGVWDDEDPEVARREVRFELSQLLLQHGDLQSADSELVALSAELPADAALYTRVAGLLVQAGDLPHALEDYRHALAINSGYGPALAGAGEVAYATGDYAGAQNYLRRAVQVQPRDTRSAHLLEISELVLRMDPFAVRLAATERSRRAMQAFTRAMQRLRDCAGSTHIDITLGPLISELQSLYAGAQQLQPVNERRLLREPDKIYAVMDWVIAAENAATRACAQPEGPDLALTLIGKKLGQSRAAERNVPENHRELTAE